MSATNLIRGAAVSGVIVGVLAVGAAPALAWYTTGPNGETICLYGGTYPDCQEMPSDSPTPVTTDSSGGATGTPTPVETTTAPAPVETVTATATPSVGTSTGQGQAVAEPTPTASTVAVVGGTGTTTASGAATSAATLPFTGFEVGAAAAIGLAALGAGTIFIVGSRRRKSGASA